MTYGIGRWMMDKERGDKERGGKRAEAYHHHRAAVSSGQARAESRERGRDAWCCMCLPPLSLGLLTPPGVFSCHWRFDWKSWHPCPRDRLLIRLTPHHLISIKARLERTQHKARAVGNQCYCVPAVGDLSGPCRGLGLSEAKSWR